MIASKNRDALGISNLERDKKSDRLDRIVASIDVIAYYEG